MRHFGSLLLTAVFAPSIFLLTGTGLSAFHSALDDNKLFDPLGSLAALGALLLAGVLYAILVMVRLSPLGPGLAGLGALAISGWALVDIAAYQAFFSGLNVHMGGAVGETGLGILLGIPLLATLFSGRRWRRSELYPPAAVPLAAPQSEPTWVLPATPVYQSTPLPEMPLPDIAPPSLRYPLAAAFPSQAAATQPPTAFATPASPVPEAPADVSRFSAPLAAPPVSAPPVSAPPVSAPPVSAPPVSAPPVSAPPVSAPPVSAPPDSAGPGFGPPELHPSLAALDEISLALRPISGPPAQITMATSEAAPLPRRVPTPPPGSQNVTAPNVTAPVVSPPPPPDNEVTERLGPPGSIASQVKPVIELNEDETVQLRPES